jgi:hypothetical protein
MVRRRAPAPLLEKLATGAKLKEYAMPQKLNSPIAVIGIDIGKNSFHLVGHDKRGAIMLCNRSDGCTAHLRSVVGLGRVKTRQKSTGHRNFRRYGGMFPPLRI